MTISEIATAIKCPEANVAANWPLLVTCLKSMGIYSEPVAVAMLATVAVETAHTFKPIKEMGGEAYLKGKKYWPYFGRGFLQMTWQDAYERYGKMLGIDLVNNPDLALDPNVSASHAAAFFRDNHIASPAHAGEWKQVRKKVNGGYGALEDFMGCVDRLEWLKGRFDVTT